MPGRLSINLDEREVSALVYLARIRRRKPKEQAEFLIVEALRAAGVLADDLTPPLVSDSQLPPESSDT